MMLVVLPMDWLIAPFGMKQAVHTGPKASQEVDQPISIGTQETWGVLVMYRLIQSKFSGSYQSASIGDVSVFNITNRQQEI